MEERLHSLQEEVRIIKQNSLGDDNDECNGRGVMIMTVVVVLMVTVMVIVIVMMLVVMVMMMTDPSGLQEFFLRQLRVTNYSKSVGSKTVSQVITNT